MVAKKLKVSKIKADAVALCGTYEHNKDEKIRLGKEGIITLMRTFEKVHGRRPSVSDARRRLIAPASSYYYYFKTWKQALAYAFPN